MNENPLVSIVLPVYNGERYLDQAIQSCIDQEYTRWELIVVDDCSMDRSSEIAKKYINEDKRIHYIRHDQNKKLPAALNTGFKNASGVYYTWTSDDNYYDQAAIGKMVDFMNLHPEVDIVYSDHTIIEENGNFTEKLIVEDPDMIVYHNCVGACFMYKSLVHLSLNGYDEELFLIEDYDFWLRASKRFKMKPIHENLYFYRRHSKSLTDEYREKIISLTKKVRAPYEIKGYQIDIDKINDHSIFIWGTGKGGETTYHSLMADGFKIRGFIDSNSTKWGKLFLNLKIYSPSELKGVSDKLPFIFIGSVFIKEIEDKLIELGYTKGKDYCVTTGFRLMYP